MSPTLLAILAYVAAQIGIGVWASRRVRSEDDYLVAGRRLGHPLAIFSLFATWFGAETCVGAAGEVQADGLSSTSAEPFGYGLCLVIMGLVFAAPLWRRKLVTLADLFRQRYSAGVERFAAVVLIPTSLLWAAAQIRAFGHVLSSASGLEVEVAVALAALLVMLYTSVGGMLADAVTDLVQGALLIAGLLVLLGGLLARAGGPGELLAAIDTERVFASKSAPLALVLESWAVPVCGSVVATELVARVISCRSAGIAARSSVIAGAGYVAIGLIPVLVGLTSGALFTAPVDPEQVLPTASEQLLPAALNVLFAGALVSAILSTVDSALLVASSLLSHNLIVPLARRDIGERVKVRIARAGVLGFGAIAYVLARRAGTVVELVEESSAFGSAGTLVVVCFGLFTRIGGALAAHAAIAAGLAVYLCASFGGAQAPFLLSLGAALLAYLLGALYKSPEDSSASSAMQ